MFDFFSSIGRFFSAILTKIFGTKYERDLKRLRPIVDEINEVCETLSSLDESELKAKTEGFKARLAQASSPEEERGLMEEILPEAFALVKEACRRLMGRRWHVCGLEIEWDMVPYDEQLIGGIVLYEGKIAEMATGEGKTLVATMPLYLNALTGKSVHLVTVNDYLARRDSEWMGPIYEMLGLTVGCIQNEMTPAERKEQYSRDITYGTNNEFGFDYLRDNMAVRKEDRVQRGHNYAIVDEVDSVLVDEARTPLIIAGPVASGKQQFEELKPRVERLVRNQTQLVNKLMAEAEKLLDEGGEDGMYDAGIKLLQVRRGAPKNKRLLRQTQDGSIKKLIHRVEMDFLRDKRMGEVDEELFYTIDEKGQNVDMSEKGRNCLAPDDKNLFVIPDLPEEMRLIGEDSSLPPAEKAKRKAEVEDLYVRQSDRIHSIYQLVKAYSLFEKDVEYVVKDGKVMIVDEFTGRLMPGRRYSEGLHQALEAKEGVKVEGETQTLATITLQNLFRLYDKLAGMTGTAETEAAEFYQIYKLDVVVIPTHKPVRRVDYDDVIYRTRREKYNALIEEIVEMHRQKRPVLVGTVSVEVSETLSRLLKRTGINHSVLNAKYHQSEAEIVAEAGRAGAVTIATNMAGRGTDIKLGPGVVQCEGTCVIEEPESSLDSEQKELKKKCLEGVPCGLHIIGTERHESRRIDRQLRGRSGRQGDPGSSRFYLSLEDDLMRLFGSERIAGVMDRLGVQEGEVIQHGMVTRAIEKAQKRVEAHNFDIRKHLLEYDDVMNQQREVVYGLRKSALEGDALRDEILEYIAESVEEKCGKYIDPKSYWEEWDLNGLAQDMETTFVVPLELAWVGETKASAEEVAAKLIEGVQKAYEAREQEITPEVMRQVEKYVVLQVIDEKWRDHLYEIDQLKGGIGLRAYGQKDPLMEYKNEAYNMFVNLMADVKDTVVRNVFRVRVSAEPEPASRAAPSRAEHAEVSAFGTPAGPEAAAGASTGKRRPVQRAEPKVRANDPCPCGSGKKYKKCCMKKLETV
ncbi:MAG: preprotein translocase subunit SecA [Dehalococcoidia bacterium DG_22]|nr:MAG: preprotein translocase subunit SecA [Dehalococcoidia bacterium DG_22]